MIVIINIPAIKPVKLSSQNFENLLIDHVIKNLKKQNTVLFSNHIEVYKFAVGILLTIRRVLTNQFTNLKF